jgi:hypothetical protein
MPKKYLGLDERWIRHDWRLWVRPDFARWLKPGVEPADFIPTLARERALAEEKRAREEAAWAAEDAAFEAWIESERRWLAAINQEMNEVNAEMARWRRRLAEEEAKYSPSQPRVPAGNSRGGQWTDGSTSRGSYPLWRSSGSANAASGAENQEGYSYDATPSQSATDQPQADGSNGYDDRLAASDKPSPGRAALLGVMARAAEKIVQLYRSENLLLDLFGEKTGAVAVTTMDDKDILGSNSTSPTYTRADREAANELRDKLAEKYPGIISAENAGHTSANALFHAETNVLLRAAEQNGGTLAGRSLDIYVDRNLCGNCQRVVPLVGLELGNPTLTYVDPERIFSIANGKITSRSRR